MKKIAVLLLCSIIALSTGCKSIIKTEEEVNAETSTTELTTTVESSAETEPVKEDDVIDFDLTVNDVFTKVAGKNNLIVVDISYTNKSDKTKEVNYRDFQLYLDNVQQTNASPDFFAGEFGDDLWLVINRTSVNPGRTLNGYILFLYHVDSYSVLEFECKSDWNITFTADEIREWTEETEPSATVEETEPTETEPVETTIEETKPSDAVEETKPTETEPVETTVVETTAAPTPIPVENISYKVDVEELREKDPLAFFVIDVPENILHFFTCIRVGSIPEGCDKPLYLDDINGELNTLGYKLCPDCLVND